VEVEERTRDLVAAALGVGVIRFNPPTYRSTARTSLDGEWLGGFAQPGVILNTATAMHFTLAEGVGRSIDEYGPATWTIAKNDGDRVELSKGYTGANAARFHYVGRLSEGTLAGYWYSPARPDFCGVFWLGRSDTLSEESKRALQSRIRGWSWRRPLVRFVFGAPAALFVLAWFTNHSAAALLAFNVWFLLIPVCRMRAQRFHKEVARWRTLLG
jgi:hypothetical protein